MMSGQFETFHAKILLFGEYSLMYGSGAVSIPFREKHVQLQLPASGIGQDEIRNAYNSNKLLKSYLQFLISKKKSIAAGIDLGRMRHDIGQGLFLRSNIPTGYGLGSSGALVAALFKHYGELPDAGNNSVLDHDRLQELKNIFAIMESFFHGSSSGLDPLSSYLKQPLLINSDQKLSVISDKWQQQYDKGGFFLLDTKKQRKTHQMVGIFKEKYTQKDFRHMINSDYVPVCNSCINALLTEDKGFVGFVHRLSALQFKYFPEMIPVNFQQIWKHGLSTGLFSLKLCGAGGGGYLLGYAQKPYSDLKELFKSTWNLQTLPIGAFTGKAKA